MMDPIQDTGFPPTRTRCAPAHDAAKEVPAGYRHGAFASVSEEEQP